MVGKGKSTNVKPKIKLPKPGGRTQAGKVSKKRAKFQQLHRSRNPKPSGVGGATRIQQQQQQKKKPSNQQGQQPPKTNARVPYTPEQTIFIVGEGDFSFCRGLCEVLSSGNNIVASTLDDEATTRAKYGEARTEGSSAADGGSAVLENITEIRETYDGEVIFGLDATKVASNPKYQRFLDHFDRVVFNFPHAGKGIKDQVRNIQSNQLLLQGFFENVIPLLTKDGEIHVTLKSGEPYDSWDVVKLARLEGLEVKDCIVFNPDLYPGYEHRRTLGFKAGLSADKNQEIKRKLCKTYMFKVKVYDPNAKKKKAKAEKKPKPQNQDHDDDD